MAEHQKVNVVCKQIQAALAADTEGSSSAEDSARGAASPEGGSANTLTSSSPAPWCPW